MKIVAAELSKVVNEALRKYGDECRDIVEDTAKEVANGTRNRLRNTSPKRPKGGKYAKGWQVTEEPSRLGKTYVVHNKKPGLPHLLENGHAKRNGTGWVNGKPHIAPAERAAVEEFQLKLASRLGGAG